MNYMDSETAADTSTARQITINTAGLLLLFGWACYVLVNWLVYRYLPDATATAGAVVGAGYLLAVGALLFLMATQALKSNRHLTYRSVIARDTAPVRFWLLTFSMGGIGTTLIGAGAFALVRTLLFR